jgi:hypothetical protein
MGIIQLPVVLPAQIGILPQMKRMVTTDNLSTITTAGYLNGVDLQSNPIASSDVLDVLYGYNLQTNTGTFGIFTVSITNGVITLVQWANPGDVLLPVVANDLASFNGTTGQIKDSGILSTNVMSIAATNIMAAGSEIILDKGTATTTAGAATLNKQSGVLTTPSLTTASGAAYTVTLTNSEITASSVILCQIQGGTNTTPGITIIATPTSGSATILLENSGVAAAALNGTVIFSFVVF